jgi:pimeloyl-ACP methyl ester carboxylesterase
MMTGKTLKTSRLSQFYLDNEQLEAEKTILFIHGNGSSATFWTTIIAQLNQYRCIAPDLRGYGNTEAVPIDATDSMQDVVLDLAELLSQLGVTSVHLVAHSLGGAVAYQLAAHLSSTIKSICLVNPCSPFGFGGTKGEKGDPIWPDFAGSGGGIANKAFVERLAKKDKSLEQPESAPRAVMNQFYWHNSFQPSTTLEQSLLDSLLAIRIGDEFYPGDSKPSANYPFVAPGIYGPINAISPKYMLPKVQEFIQKTKHIPILWVRGKEDAIVSDHSLFDFGWLGLQGFVPDYPGEEVYPPQPMVTQTRYVLEKRKELGGLYKEVTIADCGHSPFLEKEELFLSEFTAFIEVK